MESTRLIPTRFPALDYLRGLMALSVLVFHYDKWLTGYWDASLLQGRLGVYAVSIFFVLSGLTLTLVYEQRLNDQLHTWGQFFRKRLFRIFPLLWLATAATLLLDDHPRTAKVIFLNFTGLFGFINPAEDIATGAWSIGCELVFYAAFPTLLLLAKRSQSAFLAVLVAFFALATWTSFAWFSPLKSHQTDWWSAYVQVANHAIFFVGGMAIGIFREILKRISRRIWISVLVFTALIFTGWPVDTGPFFLISGSNRVVFMTLTLLAVTSFFNSNLVFKGLAHQFWAWLGAISYSLYLLHPLVYRAMHAAFMKAGILEGYWQLFITATLAALFLSHFTYHFTEVVFCLGKTDLVQQFSRQRNQNQ